MQRLGSHGTEERYARVAVKVRIIREIVRRIKTQDWSFRTVDWGVVQQEEINEDYDGTKGPVLAILDGLDTYALSASKSENSCDVVFQFAITPGENEIASDMLNNVAADLVETIGAGHKLREGGVDTGDQLAVRFQARSFEGDVQPDQPCAMGWLTFEMGYRHGTHKPFDLT